MGSLIHELKGKYLATGVGSLPHTEAPDAARLVFDVLSQHIPFWPQLPQASFYENMYVQYCQQLPGVVLDEVAKTIRVQTQGDDYLLQLEAVFKKISEEDVDFFSIAASYAQGLYALASHLSKMQEPGWVKAQVIGPLTLGLSLLDEQKNPILYNPELGEILAPFLGMKAAWVIRHLKASGAGRVIIFIDEPYLVAVGTSQCSLPAQAIIEKINRVARVIHENGALAGLHCCGNTDWELVMQTDIDILNFDAYGYVDKLSLYERAVEAFLKKDRLLAIGIVPNDEGLKRADVQERLWTVLKKHPIFLKNGALITSSCGCSGLTKELARQALAMSADIAQRLQRDFN